jgi:poly(3-hydroxybutyrate) depolymerase
MAAHLRNLTGIVLAASVAAGPARAESAPEILPQERQCLEKGWQRAVVASPGGPRALLWKAPPGAWRHGAILVMHGGGGRHFQFCVANVRFLEPQVAFTTAALARGFAVFLLDSSDRVLDNEGRLCGKVWDDEVRARPNFDLPMVGAVIDTLVAKLRPPGSAGAVFLTGLSSGAYMTLRAATHFGDRIAGFAPVAGGDPYGWHRNCDPALARVRRATVHGVGVDNETGRNIAEPGSCAAPAYPNEKPWEGTARRRQPPFLQVQHEYDGINDVSCSHKAAAQLRRMGYPAAPPLIVKGDGRRSLANHLWQEAYNAPILDFFAARAAARE